MAFFRNLIATTLALALSFNVIFAAEWYEDYEDAKKAIAKQQWQQALNLVNSAILAKKKPNANAKTYGLRFIDYFPYLYRAIAKYHLGDFTGSEMDLKNSTAYGQVKKGKRDRAASKKLKDYSTLLLAHKSEREIKLDDSALQIASDLTDQKKYDQAAKILNNFLKKNPQHREGRALLKKNEEEGEAELAILNKKPPPIETESEERKPVATVEKPKTRRRNQPKKNDTIIVKKDKDVSQHFQEGLAFFESGDLRAARPKFQQVGKASVNYLEANEYLQKINKAEKQVREGVTSFFDGNTEQSIKWLNLASNVYETNPSVYAFLGCAHATEYFLSGEEDKESLQKALAEFDKIKKMDSGYRLDSRYFSPRIIDLFVQAPPN